MIKLTKAIEDAGIELVKQPVGVKGNYGTFGDVDFDSLTVPQAQKLVRKGFPYLAAVKTDAKAEATTAKEQVDKPAAPAKK